MRKTLGDYNIEKSSSVDVNNINWSKKKVNDDKKPKKKKILKTTQIPSGTKIIYKNENKKIVNSKIQKLFCHGLHILSLFHMQLQILL